MLPATRPKTCRPTAAVKQVVDALKRLEYRGYDSAGARGCARVGNPS